MFVGWHWFLQAEVRVYEISSSTILTTSERCPLKVVLENYGINRIMAETLRVKEILGELLKILGSCEVSILGRVAYTAGMSHYQGNKVNHTQESGHNTSNSA